MPNWSSLGLRRTIYFAFLESGNVICSRTVFSHLEIRLRSFVTCNIRFGDQAFTHKHMRLHMNRCVAVASISKCSTWWMTLWRVPACCQVCAPVVVDSLTGAAGINSNTPHGPFWARKQLLLGLWTIYLTDNVSAWKEALFQRRVFRIPVSIREMSGIETEHRKLLNHRFNPEF